jgi:ubiquitin C-terminal hydrolase
VPEESFSWDLDLVAMATKEERAKKKEGSFIPAVIKTDAPSKSLEPGLNQNLKMKLRENLEFSLTNVDKIFTKGFTNDSNCCFMNVCLQALLASPAFFNMLLAIGQDHGMLSQLS